MNTKKLKNGLKIFSYKIPNNDKVAINLFVKCGARWESDKYLGASDFFSRLCFETSENLDITTFKEFTRFSIVTDSENFKAGTDELYNTVRKNEWSAAVFEKVKGEALLNITKRRESYADAFEKNVFKGGELSKPVFGDYDCVKEFENSDIANFKQKYYVGENMFLLISGDICDNDVRYAEKLFSEGFEGKPQFSIPRLPQSYNIFKVIEDEYSPSEVRISFMSDYSEGTREELLLLASVAADFMGGQTEADCTTFSDIALLNIYFEVSEEKLEDVFIEFSKRLKDIEITKELLQRSKRAFEKQISEEANDCEKWCDELGWEIALSRIPAQTLEEIKKRYENIDIDRLNKCAKKLFKNKNANVQIIGETDKCDIEKCRKLWKDEHRDIFL